MTSTSAERGLDVSRFYIGGQWADPSSDETIDVTESATGQVMGTAPRGQKADVDAAVEAAREAFERWALVPVGERAQMLEEMGNGLASRVDELAELEAREIGTPIEESREGQVIQAAEFLRAIPGEVQKVTWQEDAQTALALRVPVGVVGAITAWNFPLQIAAAKAGAAMAAGCSVVVKVSEVAPLAVFALAEEAHKVGIPAGVLNMITGLGSEAGAALSAHPAVAKLSFTGSIATARSIAADAAPTLKALHLELGGKSASVILDDADLERAISGSLANAFQGTGQVCCATTRILVPADRIGAAEEALAASIELDWPVGDPLDAQTKLGPLVSDAQLDRVSQYINLGVEEGARLIAGGPGRPEGLERGYFVRPTVFSGDNSMRVAREEIFGPVVMLIGYENGDDGAALLANDTDYGLGGAVWSDDDEHALQFARRLRSGQVELNGAAWDGTAPFGGFGDSGFGRENGRWGIEEYTTWQAFHR